MNISERIDKAVRHAKLAGIFTRLIDERAEDLGIGPVHPDDRPWFKAEALGDFDGVTVKVSYDSEKGGEWVVDIETQYEHTIERRTTASDESGKLGFTGSQKLSFIENCYKLVPSSTATPVLGRPLTGRNLIMRNRFVEDLKWVQGLAALISLWHCRAAAMAAIEDLKTS